MNRPMPGLQPTKLSYNIPESASALGVSKSTIYNKIASGELRAAKVYGRTVIPAEDLRAALAAALAAA